MGQIFVPVNASASPTVAGLSITSAEPRIIFTETGVAANQGKWDFDVNNSTFALRTRTDADGAGVDVLSVARNGVNIDGIAGIVIGNATLAASATINFGAVSLQAQDELDFTSKVIAINATGGGGSSLQMLSDRDFLFLAGQDGGASSFELRNDNGDVLISGGGVDGDIALTCTGTGTINCTGQIIQNSVQLVRTSVAFTNNAGAAAATLLNGPTAGNPTKWIPINDNGTIRNIPAW